ncbi:leucine-rich repeat and fibronectin type III domain-containing protein 1 [Struthio camelus]|uniref:leucine-rich repeat and fibronectin type III domain-containing protein 1 n=1 Tax=Struthio camelus TaxID=8801 RepID=UPI003603CF96
MAKLLVSLVVLGAVTRPQAPTRCPGRCICPTPAPNPTLLCAKTGLLFVPPAIDRRTVELRLTDNFIAALRRPDFANMTSLVHLTLSRNAISRVAPGAFGDLCALRALHLDGNRLPALSGAQLRGLASLRRLMLANNQLGRIEAAAFAAFAATVEDLDLSYNNLASVPWEAIGAMASLNTLTLDHNLLERVAPGALARLPKLARLDVTANRLRTVPPPAGPARFALALGGNPLHCNCELLWLRRLEAAGRLETCATPPHLADRLFWAVPEEEFVCRPPSITRARATAGAVLEGQAVSVLCAAAGDPPPALHWLAPDGRPVRNGSRRALRPDGTLELRAAALADHGAFTCVASNAAGEAAAPVALAVLPLPLPAARPPPSPPPPPAAAPSDMAGAAAPERRRIVAAELTASSARIRWPAQRHVPGIRMYQIQYNSSLDDSLVYRMIPSSSKTFVVTDLAAGREYDLCVLAVYEDGATALPAARAVGCVRFATAAGGPRCPAARPHFLGGTIIIVIGGAIAASVLVFILILTVRYKAAGARRHPTAAVASVCSQTNGAHPPGAKHPDEPEAGPPPGAEPPPVPPVLPEAVGAPAVPEAAGAARTPRHRHSFDGARGLFPSHSYPRRARTRLHGSASRLDAAGAPGPRRPAFGSTEWMLESTV